MYSTLYSTKSYHVIIVASEEVGEYYIHFIGEQMEAQINNLSSVTQLVLGKPGTRGKEELAFIELWPNANCFHIYSHLIHTIVL